MVATANSSLLPFQLRANMPTPLAIVKVQPDTTSTFTPFIPFGHIHLPHSSWREGHARRRWRPDNEWRGQRFHAGTKLSLTSRLDSGKNF
jgi:hypothetical protein